MTTTEQDRPDEEEQPQQNAGDNAVPSEQSNPGEAKGGTPRNEEESREHIQEMREEMAQSQTGFTGD